MIGDFLEDYLRFLAVFFLATFFFVAFFLAAFFLAAICGHLPSYSQNYFYSNEIKNYLYKFFLLARKRKNLF